MKFIIFGVAAWALFTAAALAACVVQEVWLHCFSAQRKAWRAQERAWLVKRWPTLALLLMLSGLTGCAGIICPPDFIDPLYCYGWGWR